MNPRQFRFLVLVAYLLTSVFISLQPLPNQDHSQAVIDSVFSPDGRFIATAGLDRSIVIWDAAQCKEIQTIALEMPVSYLAYSPDGSFLASGDAQGIISIWDTNTGALVRQLRGQPGVTTSLDYSPNGRMLISTSYQSEKVYVWNMETGSVIRRLDLVLAFEDYVRLKGAVFSPDGQFIAAANGEVIHLWNANTGAHLNDFGNALHFPHKLNFSPDGRMLVSSGDGEVAAVLWEASTGRELASARNAGSFRRVEGYSPDGHYILSRYSHWLELWDAWTLERISDLGRNHQQLSSAAYSPNGRYIVSGSIDTQATIWDAITLEAICRLGEARR